MYSYEACQRRVPVSMLPLLARTLGVSVEELIGEPAFTSKRLALQLANQATTPA